jgi:hypothetical protein
LRGEVSKYFDLNAILSFDVCAAAVKPTAMASG